MYTWLNCYIGIAKISLINVTKQIKNQYFINNLERRIEII